MHLRSLLGILGLHNIEPLWLREPFHIIICFVELVLTIGRCNQFAQEVNLILPNESSGL